MNEAPAHVDRIIGVGLDSNEIGNPPEPFAPAYDIARRAGLHAVAHGGEEGPPEYITGALDALGAKRIEHGATAEQDEALMERLVAEQVPLTICQISSLRLGVYHRMEDAHLKRFLRALAPGRSVHLEPRTDGGRSAASHNGPKDWVAVQPPEQCLPMTAPTEADSAAWVRDPGHSDEPSGEEP